MSTVSSVSSRQTHPATRSAHSGFTFLEFLLLLAVVTVVLALLLTVFVAARARGRRTECMSNLRQIGMALELYSHDYDDRLPPWLNTRVPSDPRLARWCSPDRIQLTVGRVVRDTQVLFCPTDDDIGKDIERFGVNHRYSSYFYNLHPAADKPIRVAIQGLFEGDRLLCESSSYPVVQDPNTAFLNGRGSRSPRGCEHLKGVNVVYLDWHAEYHR